MRNTISLRRVMLIASALVSFSAQAQTSAPQVAVNPLRNAYFGQLHLHTGMSFDAYLIGTRLFPEDAYRFARGEQIEQAGRKWTPSGPPLDFLGVSDHSEYLGQMRLVADPNGPLAQSEFAKALLATPESARFNKLFALSDGFGSGGIQPQELLGPELMKSNWQRQIDAANKFYQPGKFTTFVAY